MKNLEREDLRLSFKENILFALRNKKNVGMTIRFKFKDSTNFKFKGETIYIFGSGVKYKDVHLGSYELPWVIEILIDNFFYSDFSLIDTEINHGEIKCHGFGDYWGEDKITFTYYRFDEENKKRL